MSGRSHASIGKACRMMLKEVRARLVMLESMRLVAGRPDPDAPRGRARRVYGVTDEGRRKTALSDARQGLGAWSGRGS